MNYSFFFDQLTQARDKFTLDPEVEIFSNGIHVPVDKISYDTNYNNRKIVIHFIGGSENWEKKYEGLLHDYEGLQAELRASESLCGDHVDEISELKGEKEDLNLEIAELCSKVEDLEEEIGEMRRKNRDTKESVTEIKKTLIQI